LVEILTRQKPDIIRLAWHIGNRHTDLQVVSHKLRIRRDHVLEDGSIVRVDGKPEQLVEISAANAQELARLAWHLGNRHTDVEIAGDKLRIRRDHVLEAMLRGLGATLTELEAPFHPEAGAYGRHDHE